MRREEIFAVLLALLCLGAGAYLSTFPTDVIRGLGIALMLGATIGLVIWFVWERKIRMNSALLISVGSIGLLVSLGVLYLGITRLLAGSIVWSFQRDGYAVPINWSLERVGVPLEFHVDGFQFNGRTDRQLYQVDAWVTIDRTGQRLPLYIAAGGQWTPFAKTDGVPEGATFQMGCSMREEEPRCGAFASRMTPERFLAAIGAFTFSFLYDGHNQSWHFSADELQRQFIKQKAAAEQKTKSDPLLQPRVQRHE
jgi:hypothetical protein